MRQFLAKFAIEGRRAQQCSNRRFKLGVGALAVAIGCVDGPAPDTSTENVPASHALPLLSASPSGGNPINNAVANYSFGIVAPPALCAALVEFGFHGR